MPAWLWIVIGAVVLGALCGGNGKNSRKASSGRPFRIDRPHYLEDDDCQCSRCGARFREKTMVCPRCGARFGTSTTDDLEFIEEMEIWDGDDD